MTAEADRCRSRIAHESGAVLRCQDIPGHVGNHVTVREQWGDDDDRVCAELPLEPHHAAARQRTDEEQAALEGTR